jgi:hypothetical protein
MITEAITAHQLDTKNYHRNPFSPSGKKVADRPDEGALFDGSMALSASNRRRRKASVDNDVLSGHKR